MKYRDMSNIVQVCCNCGNVVNIDCEGDLRCKLKAKYVWKDTAGNEMITGGQTDYLGSCELWEKEK